MFDEGIVSQSSGLAKNHLTGYHDKGEEEEEVDRRRGGRRRRGTQKKRWEDTIKEWAGLEMANSHRGLCGEQEKIKRAGCKVVSHHPYGLRGNEEKTRFPFLVVKMCPQSSVDTDTSHKDRIASSFPL